MNKNDLLAASNAQLTCLIAHRNEAENPNRLRIRPTGGDLGELGDSPPKCDVGERPMGASPQYFAEIL